MANIKSAEKRARQTIKRTARNKSIKTRVKNSRKSVQAGDAAQVTATLGAFSGTADKAANAGVIHRNTANRLKSRAAKAALKGAVKAVVKGGKVAKAAK
jgi:small subunit ribosomal protein S20